MNIIDNKTNRYSKIFKIHRVILLQLQKHWFVPKSLRILLLRASGVRIKNGFIGNNVNFDTVHPDLIEIQEGCIITGGTTILTHFLNPNTWDMPTGKVIIGNKVFIGMNTIICNAVNIGDYSVIGAGSVVTKDIPSGEIWAGNPAHFISKKKNMS